MGEVKSFRDLIAWQVGMRTVELTYLLTSRLPDHERYGLTSQMRRAAVSIPSNLAEGQGVRARRWTLRHISTAIGSSCELDTQLEAAIRLRFVTTEQAKPLAESIDRVQKLLYGLRRKKEASVAQAAATAGLVFLLFGQLLS